MLYEIFGKTWLQADPYMFRGLRNAILGRYEKYNILIGVVLFLTALSVLGFGLVRTLHKLLVNQSFELHLVLWIAIVFAVLMYVALHQLTLRDAHKKLIINFTTRTDQYRRLIPESDTIFQSIMFPQYVEYLKGRERHDVNIDAWQILLDYVREALNQEEIINLEIEHLDCTELEAINLENEYERFVLQIARVAGAKIAAILEIETDTFFDDRAKVLEKEYRSELTQMISDHEGMNREAKAIIASLG